MIPVIEIDEMGNIRTLYTDHVNLYALGRVKNICRASHIEFDETRQEWDVIQASSGKIVHRNKNRENAVKWEILHFQPGGKFYDQND